MLKTIRAGFAAGRAARCTWHYSILAQLIAMSPMAAARVAAEPAPQVSNAAGEYERAVEGALTAFREHKFNEARALFEQADRLQRSARTLRGLGATDLALSRYTIAKTELEDALIDIRNPLTLDQHNEVLSWLAWMNSSLAVLRLELSPSQASLVIDTERTTARLLLLDPGEHSVRVHADGFEPFERNVTLERGKPQLLHVALDRVDPAGSRSQTAPVKAPVAATRQALPTTPEHKPALTERWWFWTGLVAIVAAGSVTAIVLSTRPQPAPYASGGLGGKVEALQVQP